MRMSQFTKLTSAFFLCLFAFYTITMALSPVKPTGFAWDASAIGLPAFELIFFGVLTVTIWTLRSGIGRWPVLLASLSVPIIVGTCYMIQMISVTISGKYVSVLAMENMTEVSYVSSALNAALISGMVLFLTAVFWAGARDIIRRRENSAPIRSGLFGFVAVVLLGAAYSERREYLPIVLDTNLAPAIELFETYKQYSRPRVDQTRVARFEGGVADGTVVSPFAVDVNAEFPFLQSTLEFSENSITDQMARAVPPNVIIVFLEGVSARVLGHYGGAYGDLTPNLDTFASRSVTVDSYFSHTAASIRGIQGAMTSGFPGAGGPDGWETDADSQMRDMRSVSYQTLPLVLAQSGYDTHFYSHNDRGHTFHNFLRHIGFEAITVAQDVLGENAPDVLHDGHLFEHLAKVVRERDASGDQQPFLWSTLSYGSHAFLDAREDGTLYGDGTNAALNRFHDLDASMAQFLEAFEESELSKNTILIITSDHSSFPDPAATEAFEDTPMFTENFIDQIPLIVRLPGDVAPQRIDAGIRTSLDLAPTVLHLLGIEDLDHAFLGTSVLNADAVPNKNWGSIGPDFFRLDDQGVTLLSPEVEDPQDRTAVDAVMFYYDLELQNRVFPRHEH